MRSKQRLLAVAVGIAAAVSVFYVMDSVPAETIATVRPARKPFVPPPSTKAPSSRVWETVPDPFGQAPAPLRAPDLPWLPPADKPL